MTPEDEAMLRARLNVASADDYVRGPSGPRGPIARAPAPDEGPSKFSEALGRVRQSGTRMAENPAMQGLQALGNPAPFLNIAGRYAADELELGRNGPDALAQKTRARVSALEAAPLDTGPAHVNLQPMSQGIEPTMSMAPTLDPRYGQSRAPSSGGGGGSGGNGMGQLAREYRDAQGNMIRSFNTEQDLVERRGELHGERAEKEAQERDLMAARATRDAEVKAQHDAEIEGRHAAFLARNQELADDITSQKISPQSVIDDMGGGTKIGLIIAGALNGAAGQGPAMMARVDGIVEQGVRAQIANVDGKKAKLAARQSIFQQMMAESGDRKVAEQQTRALAWEAVKHKADADARRRGIPEEMVNAELLRNEIDEKKINPLRVQLTGDALRTAQAQAAAAAAAQRAAEEKAYQRMKDEREFGLKSDAQKIEIMKLDRKEGDDVNAETSKLGAALADPKLANGRAAVENSKRRLGISEDGTVKLDAHGKPVVDQEKGLPGVGGMADFRDRIAPTPTGALAVLPHAWLLNKTIGLDNDERVSRGDWDKMQLAYQVQVTGSGGSEEQMRQIKAAFSGAKTAKEQRNAVAEADAVFRQIEGAHKAGVSPRALQTFEGRLKGVAPSMPSSVTVKR